MPRPRPPRATRREPWRHVGLGFLKQGCTDAALGTFVDPVVAVKFLFVDVSGLHPRVMGIEKGAGDMVLEHVRCSSY